MTDDELDGVLAFLRDAERLKDTLRNGLTRSGRTESTAEHSWRLALMAMLLGPAIPGVDAARLVRICLVHDLAEALTGDVPAPLAPEGGKSSAERAALTDLTAPLPPAMRAEVMALWEEYEAGSTPEGRAAKGLDKLETILQHAEGQHAPGFDLAFNLGYGRAATSADPLLARLRAKLDAATRQRLAITMAGSA